MQFSSTIIGFLEAGQEQFVLCRGICDEHVEQLLEYVASGDEVIAKFTSDPVRFRSREAFEVWYAKERFPYTLVDTRTGQLVGMMWWGRKKMPEGAYFDSEFKSENYGITMSIRLYQQARGKGLALPFIQKTFNDFRRTKVYLSCQNSGLWLETEATNVAAISVYKKFGFTEVSAPDEGNEIVMVC